MKKLGEKVLTQVLSLGALVTDKQERHGRSRNRDSNDKSDRFDKSRGRSKLRGKNIKCFYCDKPGHFKKECRLWKRECGKGKGEDTIAATADGEIVVT